jgi:hypothetical protein
MQTMGRILLHGKFVFSPQFYLFIQTFNSIVLWVFIFTLDYHPIVLCVIFLLFGSSPDQWKLFQLAPASPLSVLIIVGGNFIICFLTSLFFGTRRCPKITLYISAPFLPQVPSPRILVALSEQLDAVVCRGVHCHQMPLSSGPLSWQSKEVYMQPS